MFPSLDVIHELFKGGIPEISFGTRFMDHVPLVYKSIAMRRLEPETRSLERSLSAKKPFVEKELYYWMLKGGGKGERVSNDVTTRLVLKVSSLQQCIVGELPQSEWMSCLSLTLAQNLLPSSPG